MKKTVLIADDAAFMRMMLKDILTRAKYEVVGEAANGKEAVELQSQLRPDLTLLDITMPEKDGQQALKEILALDPGATVIMIAAMGEEKRALLCTRDGAEGFLSKPFQEKRVLEDLKKILG
ncbi:MAG: response regulator [Anaerovoracaceae bacterium]